jgi:hypothetical protein
MPAICREMGLTVTQFRLIKWRAKERLAVLAAHQRPRVGKNAKPRPPQGTPGSGTANKGVIS